MGDDHAVELYDRIFGHAASARPDHPCLVTDEGTWTYLDIDRRARRWAAVLRDQGVTPGRTVVVQVDKSVEAVALYLGCLLGGAVHVPLNTAYTDAEVAFFVDDADAALVIRRTASSGAVALTDLAAQVEREPGAEVTTGDRTGTGTGTGVDRTLEDPAAMLYTSGTTGRSKGAVLRGRNLVANAAALAEVWRFDSDDVLLHVLPVFHVHGLFVALHCAWAVGATTLFRERFAPSTVIDALPAATVFMGVPTHYHRLLREPGLDRDACAGMRLFTSGSAPLPAAEHEAFADRTGHHIVERYGMTETMILTSNPYEPAGAGGRVAGTVGYPLPGVDLRVVGDDARPCPAGEVGSVQVRGDGVFLGYHGLPDKTAAATTDDGWFVTGDLGALDPTGRLTLSGRSSDLIISGGLNVYPKEIEAVLLDCAGVAEAAVVGVPDPDFGEAVVAVVTGDDACIDEDELRAACTTVLARFKHPRRYVVTDVIPRNAMGKVQKSELRRQLLEQG